VKRQLPLLAGPEEYPAKPTDHLDPCFAMRRFRRVSDNSQDKPHPADPSDRSTRRAMVVWLHQVCLKRPYWSLPYWYQAARLSASAIAITPFKADSSSSCSDTADTVTRLRSITGAEPSVPAFVRSADSSINDKSATASP
jgi:hypothetical protein